MEELQRLSQQQLVEFAQTVLGPGSSSRRKLVVLVRGKQEQAAAGDKGNCTAPGVGEGGKEDSNGSLAAAQGTCPAPIDAAAANGSTSSKDTAASRQAASQQCPAGQPSAAAAAAPAEDGAGTSQQEEDLLPCQAEVVAAAAVAPGEGFQVIHDLWAFKRSCEVYPSISSARAAGVVHGRAAGVGGAAAAAAAAASKDADNAEVSAKL